MTETLDAMRGSAFAGLSKQIRAAGLLHRRRISYSVRILATLGAYAATWYAFVMVGDSWYQTSSAVAMGLAFTQVAFLGHDGGHQQVGRTRRGNDILGLITGDLLVGLCYGWWVGRAQPAPLAPESGGQRPRHRRQRHHLHQRQAANRAGGRAVHRQVPGVAVLPAADARGFEPPRAASPAQEHAIRKYRRTELTMLVVHFVVFFAHAARALAGEGAGVPRDPAGASSASTWAARSRRTTRACRPSRDDESSTSCAARC